MKGSIIVLEQGEGIFEGNLGPFGIKSNGKLRKRTIKAVLPDMSKRQIVLECRSYQPKQLLVCIRPDRDSLVTFTFKRLRKTGKYREENGEQSKQNKRHPSGKSTPWVCSFKMK